MWYSVPGLNMLGEALVVGIFAWRISLSGGSLICMLIWCVGAVCVGVCVLVFLLCIYVLVLYFGLLFYMLTYPSHYYTNPYTA